MRAHGPVLILALFCLCVEAAAQEKPTSASKLALQKSEPAPFGGKWYGSLEMRHHVSTYFDEQGGYEQEIPSMHIRMQVGAQFYEGLLDAYATAGVFKLASTQQVLQRRPELALDVHVLRSTYLDLLQYNIVQLPFETEEPDPDVLEELLDPGTIYTLGFAAVAKVPVMLGSTRVEPKIGLDAWTRLFSRKQYTSEYDDRRHDVDTGRLGLVDENLDEKEPIEDKGLRYDHQLIAGFVVNTGILPQLTLEPSANYHSRFAPRYETYESGADYVYGVDRYSYFRFRLQYELSERLSLANDFYEFHGGLFAGDRKGQDRRYRNIARLTCKL